MSVTLHFLNPNHNLCSSQCIIPKFESLPWCCLFWMRFCANICLKFFKAYRVICFWVTQTIDNKSVHSGFDPSECCCQILLGILWPRSQVRWSVGVIGPSTVTEKRESRINPSSQKLYLQVRPWQIENATTQVYVKLKRIKSGGNGNTLDVTVVVMLHWVDLMDKGKNVHFVSVLAVKCSLSFKWCQGKCLLIGSRRFLQKLLSLSFEKWLSHFQSVAIVAAVIN